MHWSSCSAWAFVQNSERQSCDLEARILSASRQITILGSLVISLLRSLTFNQVFSARTESDTPCLRACPDELGVESTALDLDSRQAVNTLGQNKLGR
jgi:hypothetical protein